MKQGSQNKNSQISQNSQNSQNNAMHLHTLLHQHLLQIQDGHLFPERIPVSTMDRVLDLGCGAGDWIFDLTKRFPQLHIYGVDIDEDLLHQARIRRNAGSIQQVELRTMDIRQPLDLPDHSFDFIHMRRCAQFIAPQTWPHFIAECVRLLKPDGWLTIVELELCEISSPACLAIHQAMLQTNARMGRSLDVTGATRGVAQRLYSMLQRASLEEVSYDLYTIDLGYMAGNSAHVFLQEFLRNAYHAKPLLIQHDVLTAQEFDQLIAQANRELNTPDVCGWAILVSVYGKRL